MAEDGGLRLPACRGRHPAAAALRVNSHVGGAPAATGHPAPRGLLRAGTVRADSPARTPPAMRRTELARLPRTRKEVG